MPKQKSNISRFGTTCCALGIFSISNEESLENIQATVDYVKKETELKWNPNNRAGGERAMIVITTLPYEQELADKLQKVGFTPIYNFHRRNGYPEGENQMWIISW